MPLNVMLIYIHVDCLGREPFQKVICDVMILFGICIIISLISLYHYSQHLHCDDDCIGQIITLTRAASQHRTKKKTSEFFSHSILTACLCRNL